MTNGRNRCPWVKLNDPIYVKYHDEEWGVPLHVPSGALVGDGFTLA